MPPLDGREREEEKDTRNIPMTIFVGSNFAKVRRVCSQGQRLDLVTAPRSDEMLYSRCIRQQNEGEREGGKARVSSMLPPETYNSSYRLHTILYNM